MPLRITILSGDRQGQTLEFDQEVIEIGDRTSDHIYFDPAADPGIRDRRATLALRDGHWKVLSTGALPIFVNQETVDDSSDVRSGDFVRMSHDGPDLSCELIAELSPLATVVPGQGASIVARSTSSPSTTEPSPQPAPSEPPAPKESAESNPATTAPRTPKPVSSDSPSATVTVGTSHRNWLLPLAAGVGLLALLALVLPVAGWFWFSRSASKAPPELVPFGVIVVEEGEQVFWRPTLVRANLRDRFKLGDNAPSRMTIDETTGTVRWQTTEADGPGEYRCELVVQRSDDETARDSDWLEIRVKEVNRSPEPKSVATQTIDLSQSDELQVTLQATDPDQPTQTLTFRLSAEAPDGIELDPQSGRLQWQVPDRFANRDVTIPYEVSDSGGQTTKSVVRVRVIKPDPWEIAQQQLRGSVYMIVTETKPGKLIVPLGTACAIDDKQLLTSATVGHGINDARSRDWNVLAVDTRDFDFNDAKGWSIEKVQSHVGYVRAESIADPERRGLQQAFFDLAILTTDRELPQTCTLGDLGSSVKNDQTVACYGYEVEGDSLTQFDSLDPSFTKTKVLEVVAPPNDAGIEGRPPFLLQLIGELPFQPFGSVVIDEKGHVLGIYAFQGQVPEGVESEPVHYAVDSVHAKALLAGQGKSLWIESEPKRPVEGNQ